MRIIVVEVGYDFVKYDDVLFFVVKLLFIKFEIGWYLYILW